MNVMLALANLLSTKRRSAAYQVLVSGTDEGKPTSEGQDFDTATAAVLYQRLATVYAGTELRTSFTMSFSGSAWRISE